MNRLDYVKKDVLAIAFLVVACVIFFWPLLRDPSSLIVDDYDGIFIAWTLRTVGDNILSGSNNLFDGKIFAPHQDTLAFSDLYLSDTLLTLPVRLFTHEPVVLFNAALVLAQVLTLVFLYFVLHELTNNRLISITASAAFGFSLLRLHYLGHLHTMSIEWLLLSLLSLIKLSKIPSHPWMMVYFASFWLQTTNNFLAGYFILFTTLFFLPLQRFRRHLWQLRWTLINSFCVTFLALIPIVYPYLRVSLTHQYTRPITDAIHFALSPDQLLTTYFSPGLYFFVFAGFIILTRQFRFNQAKRYILLALGAFTLALGPALKWGSHTIKIPFHIPLPYFFLYYLVPGFQGFRTPSRWIVLAGLGATIAASILWKRWPDSAKHYLLACSIILMLLNVPKIQPVSVPNTADFPEAYFYLATLPESVVIELPIFRWGSDEFSKEEVRRMLYQTLHKHRLVNGYSGFSPSEWEQMVANIQQSPDINWKLIKERQIDTVLVHEDQYERWNKPLHVNWQDNAATHGYYEIGRFDKTVILTKNE